VKHESWYAFCVCVCVRVRVCMGRIIEIEKENLVNRG